MTRALDPYATNLPVSADLENGFGDAPEVLAETILLGVQSRAFATSTQHQLVALSPRSSSVGNTTRNAFSTAATSMTSWATAPATGGK